MHPAFGYIVAFYVIASACLAYSIQHAVHLSEAEE